MENYIQGLYEYQSHIESKYAQMLEQFQLFIESHPEEGVKAEHLSQEKEDLYQHYLKVKEEEITLLKEEKEKKEQ